MTLDAGITVAIDAITLDLHGNTITGAGGSDRFYGVTSITVESGMLTLIDTAGGGEIIGGGDYTPIYSITVEKTENGKVEANRSSTSSGNTVTLTVTPEDGYVLDVADRDRQSG